MRNLKTHAFKAIVILLILLIGSGVSKAQNWQWGLRGGGSSDGVNASPNEAVSDMATDRNGNVYITGTIESGGAPTIGGSNNYLTTYGNKDIIVASFTCNGTFRWSKVIGGASADYESKIGTDTLGHVYVIGKNTPQTVAGREIHFSTDSTQPRSNLKAIFLLQLDTNGRFKWLRQPTPDTASFGEAFSYCQSYDLHVEPNGDAYWLTQLSGGLVSGGGGWTAARYATYILKYNASGVMTDHIQPQLDLTQSYIDNLRFSRSKTGFYVFSGNVNFTLPAPRIAGSTINNTMVLAVFDSRGNYRWKRENTLQTQTTRIFSRPTIDQLGNIYYSGVCVKGDVFNGYTFTNSASSIERTVPFIGKMDSNGKHIWIQNAGGKSGSSLNSLVLKSQDEIWMSGTANSMYWTPSMFVQVAPNGGYPVYVARFNAGGSILSLDSLRGAFGGENLATCSAVDPKGNLVLGGQFNISLNIKPGTTLLNSGGASDLFVAKYGFACNCTTQPSSNFTSSITSGRTLRFSYSGSTAGIDSLVWTWGDRQRQTVKTGFAIPVSYTYTSGGNFTACANVYSSCGTASFCRTMSFAGASSVAASGLPEYIRVYPNPAERYMMLEGAEGGTVTVNNTLGQAILQQAVNDPKAMLDLSALPAGLYLLHIRDKDGNAGVVRVSKL